jgi:hypothetical protein
MNYKSLFLFKYKNGLILTVFLFISSVRIYSQNQQLNLSLNLPTGYSNLDDYYRDLVVKGEVKLTHSLNIRPLVLNFSNFNDTSKLFKPKKVYNSNSINLSILPLNILQKFNSNQPYGWNDGPLSFSKGYQVLGSGGVYVNYKNLHVIIRPEFYKTASDNYKTNSQYGQVTPSISDLGMGQSVIRYDVGKNSVSLSTQNMWLGPGRYSSLVMSNNSKGFKHISLGTNTPFNTKVGNFEYLLFSGTLTTLNNQGFENNNLKTKLFNGSLRYINGLSIVYSPKYFSNLFLGFNRVFQTYYSTLESNNGGLSKYALAFNGLFKSSYNDDKLQLDQILSIYSRWVMPKEKAEVYFEYGYNDAKSNTRDLILDNSHASASIFGLRKYFTLKNNNLLLLETEITRMSQRPTYLQRNAGNWYTHGEVIQGYTNNNQIMGAGSGLGNNVQTFAASWNRGLTKIGLQFQRINQNPTQRYGNANNLFIRNVIWNDQSVGLITRFKVYNLIFNGNIESVSSTNYLWEPGLNTKNLYIYLSTIIAL